MARAKKKKKKKTAKRKSTKKKVSPLLGLDLRQRADLLSRLLANHPELEAEAEGHAEEMLSEIDLDEVADEVSTAVELCDVDQLFAQSGRTRWGYEDPNEVAPEMLHDSIEPWMDLMRERLKLGRDAEASRICQGIILGLYQHRDGWPTTDKVLAFDPDFPSRAAEDALLCYQQVGETKRTKKKPKRKMKPLPDSFWDRVPDWDGLAALS